MKPLCIDLFCGLGGWAEGFISEGWDVVGFDIERHDYGNGAYPAQLVLQDVLTLHGRQFKSASCIVASPPCQAYSYRAMPWKRAKELPPPDNSLFDACFRIQSEACEAARRYIPMVVENVCGAQKWVGSAKWHYGSYYLWGDVPAIMPDTLPPFKGNPDGTEHGQGSWFAIADSKNRGSRKAAITDGEFNAHDGPNRGRQTVNGSWFAIGPNGKSNLKPEDGLKFGGGWWHDATNNLIRKASSRSNARKSASAAIAKIPLELAGYIARVYKP